MKKPLPKIKNEKKFLDFFEKNDFGEYLEASDLKKIRFDLKKKDRVITLRIPSDLLNLIKNTAQKHQTKYQKLIRSIIEDNITHYV